MSFIDPLKQIYEDINKIYNEVMIHNGGRIDTIDRFEGNDEWLNVSDLVCGYVVNSNLSDSVEKIKRKEKICSTNGEKISNVLIKDAISHIFNVDEQFIVELIVNGFDAQIAGKTVGKFGMGFFSALVPIVKNPGTVLSILTKHKPDPTESLTINYCAKLKIEGGILKMRMENYPEDTSFIYTSGTQILYEFKSNIDDNVVKNLLTEILKLQFYKKGQLFVSSDIPYISEKLIGELKEGTHFHKLNSSEIINEEYKNNEVFVSLNERSIIITDKGKGINSDVLLTKLLVPASSTKEIIDEEIEEDPIIIFDESNITDLYARESDSKLWINVGGVNVYNNTIVTNDDNFDYVLDLELGFDVPVARNDVLLKTETDFEIIGMHISKIMDNIVHSHKNIHTFEELMNGYNLYTTQKTASKNVDNIIKTKLISILSDSNTFAIPSNKLCLRELIAGTSVITNSVSYFATINHLVETLNELTPLFAGKTLLHTTNLDETFKFMKFDNIIITNLTNLKDVLKESIKVREILVPTVRIEKEGNVSNVSEGSKIFDIIYDKFHVNNELIVLNILENVLQNDGYGYDSFNMMLDSEDFSPNQISLIKFILNNQNDVTMIIVNMLNESFIFYGIDELVYLLHVVISTIWRECSTVYDAEILISNIRTILTPSKFYASRPDDYGLIGKTISFNCDTKNVFAEINDIDTHNLNENVYRLCGITYLRENNAGTHYISSNILMNDENYIREISEKINTNYPVGTKSMLSYPKNCLSFAKSFRIIENIKSDDFDQNNLIKYIDLTIANLGNVLKELEDTHGFDNSFVDDILSIDSFRVGYGDLTEGDEEHILNFKRKFISFRNKAMENLTNDTDEYCYKIDKEIKNLDKMANMCFNDYQINELSDSLLSDISNTILRVHSELLKISTDINQYIPIRLQHLRTREIEIDPRPISISHKDKSGKSKNKYHKEEAKRSRLEKSRNMEYEEQYGGDYNVIKKIRANSIKQKLKFMFKNIKDLTSQIENLTSSLNFTDIDHQFEYDAWRNCEGLLMPILLFFNISLAEYIKLTVLKNVLENTKGDIIRFKKSHSSLTDWIPSAERSKYFNRSNLDGIHSKTMDFLFSEYESDEDDDYGHVTTMLTTELGYLKSLYQRCESTNKYIDYLKNKDLYNVCGSIVKLINGDYSVEYFTKNNRSLDNMSLTKNFIINCNVRRPWDNSYYEKYYFPLFLAPTVLVEYLNGAYDISGIIAYIIEKDGLDNAHLKISFLILVMCLTLPRNGIRYSDESGVITPINKTISEINDTLSTDKIKTDIYKVLLLLGSNDILDLYDKLNISDNFKISVLMNSSAFINTHEYIKLIMNSPPNLKMMDISELFYKYAGRIIDSTDDILLSGFIKKMYSLDSVNLQEDIKSVPSDKFGLQIVPIAINSGSPNQVELSVAIELLQNSIDISDEIHSLRDWDVRLNIRDFKYKQEFTSFSKESKDVEIEIGYCIKGDRVSLTYENKDYIGFADLKNIVSLTVPYYSEKTTGAGQMGNGFFNCYRRSDRVIIRSKSENVNFSIEDNVIRTNGIATDVNKNFKFYEQTDEDSYTSVMIEYLPTNKSEFAFLGNVLLSDLNAALSSVPYVRGKINGKYVNSKESNKNFVLMHASENIKVFIKNSKTESYVLTQGVPFMTLKKFLKKYDIKYPNLHYMLNYELVIDISGSKYFPVQSRIDAKFDSTVINELGELIPTIIFVSHLYKGIHGDGNIALQHLSETDNLIWIDQIIPPRTYEPNKITRIDTLISTYKLQLEEETFGYTDLNISQMISYYLTKKYENICEAEDAFETKIERIFQSYRTARIVPRSEFNAAITEHTTVCRAYYNNVNRELQELQEPLVTVDSILNLMKIYSCTWILNKMKDFEKQIEDILLRYGKIFNVTIQKGGYSVDEKLVLLQTFVNVWTDILKEKSLIEIDRDPPTVIEQPPAMSKGYYEDSTNKLALNFSYISSELDSLMNYIQKNRANAILEIRTNKEFKKIFSAYSGTTLPHELEHFRRHETHSDGEELCEAPGGHNSIIISIDGINKERTFNECIMDVYTSVLSGELLNRWISNYLEIVDRN